MKRVIMKNTVILIIWLGTVLLLGCNSEDTSKTVTEKTSEISTLTTSKVATSKEKAAKDEAQQTFANAAKVLFRNRSISASLFGVADEQAGYHYASTLEDYSPVAEANFRAEMRTVSKQLLSIRNHQNKSLAENISVMVDLTRYYAGAEDSSVGFIDGWMGHSAFILNQINGPMIDIPNNLANSHTINGVEDANDYLKRLNQFDDLAKSILEKAKTDEANGWIPPKILIAKTHAYLKGFSRASVAESILVSSFATKLDKLHNLTEDDKQKLVTEAEQIVTKTVFPAFQILANYTENLIDKGRKESGIWAQPGGKKFYQYSIKRLGDTNLSADQIHQLGLDEVDRISIQMDNILKAQGYASGTVGERMVALNQEKRFLYQDSDQGRAELLQDLNTMIDEITLKMPGYFESIPPYKVEVKRIPIAIQNSSAGGYYTPPNMDGSVPGIYWINLKNTEANAKFDLKTLTYHEAVPGHHWQVALNLAQKELPLLRRLAPYNAYVEGWALYSEQVAAEMGLYENDPFSNLGRLKAELFRAVRLVVDTGLHHKQWSREQAIEYMASTTGVEIGDVTSEIERYMAWPGQALGYKLGMLKILELRTLAQTKLGEKFDLKKFHDVVLLGGAVPMSVLQNKIEQWIEDTI